MGSLERLKPEAQFPRMSLLGDWMNKGTPLLYGVGSSAENLIKGRLSMKDGA